MKRFISAVLAVVIMMTLSGGSFKSRAAVTYTGSDSYMNGKYYRALMNVQLTGDKRTDILNIARSQIGYLEGDSSGQYSGEVAGGNNYTEYGYWWGQYPNPAWCAAFVSWCAYVAGVSESVFLAHQYTENGLDFFLAKNQAYPWALIQAGVYTPKPGDLIYFYNGASGRRVTHVGLVEKFENGILYTIEGNTMTDEFSVDGGCCARHSYQLSDTKLVYICSPNYEADANTVGNYYVETGSYSVLVESVNVRNIPSSTASGTTAIGVISEGEVFNCIEVVADSDTSLTNKYWAKINYNGQTAYTSLNISNVVPVSASSDAYALSSDKTTYKLKDPIVVSASGTSTTDWVGIYKKGESTGSSSSIYWTYLTSFSGGKITLNGGTNVYNNIAVRPDGASFANGLPVGEYTIVLCAKDTNTVKKSIDISVTATGEPNIPSSASYAPVWYWDFGEMSHLAYPSSAVTGVSDTYVSFSDTTGDSWIYTAVDAATHLMSEPVNCDEAKVLVIKLRLTSNTTKTHMLELYCGSTSAASSGTFSYVPYYLAATSDWQYVVINCEEIAAQQNAANSSLLKWGGSRAWLRIDLLNSAGSSCDLDKMAFFPSVDAANDYVYADKNNIVDGSEIVVPSTATSSAYEVSDGRIGDVQGSTTVTSMLSRLSIGQYCKVYDGNTVVSAEENIATGMVVKIMDGDTVKATYTVIVSGDTDGDGYVSVTDATAALQHIRGQGALSGVFLEAALLDDGYGELDILDVAAIVNLI